MEHNKRTLQERRIELLVKEEEARISQDPLEIMYREDLEEIEKCLEQKTIASMEELALKAGARWTERGERSNQYFFQAIKQRRVKRLISSLRHPTDGLTYKSPEDIGNHARDFYQELYSPEDVDGTASQLLLETLRGRPKVKEEDNEKLLDRLKMEELFTLADYTP
ncbi:hypothetical protein BGW38_008714, partial [Lunasporangiospora selenospora]